MKGSKLALFAAVAFATAGLNLAPAFAADSTTVVDADGAQMAHKFGPEGKRGGPGKCEGGKCGDKGGFFKDLGVTTEQLEKMNTLKLDFKKSTASKRAELGTLSQELRDSMTKPGVEKGQLLAMQNKINDIKADLANSRVSFMADRLALMTDDQKSKIREHMLKRSFGHRSHHGSFKGHGPSFHHKRAGNPGPIGGDMPTVSFGDEVAPFAQADLG